MRCKNCGDKFIPKVFLRKYCDKQACVDIMVAKAVDKIRVAKEKIGRAHV